jgi:hypothetical protein
MVLRAFVREDVAAGVKYCPGDGCEEVIQRQPALRDVSTRMANAVTEAAVRSCHKGGNLRVLLRVPTAPGDGVDNDFAATRAFMVVVLSASDPTKSDLMGATLNPGPSYFKKCQACNGWWSCPKMHSKCCGGVCDTAVAAAKLVKDTKHSCDACINKVEKCIYCNQWFGSVQMLKKHTFENHYASTAGEKKQPLFRLFLDTPRCLDDSPLQDASHAVLWGHWAAPKTPKFKDYSKLDNPQSLQAKRDSFRSYGLSENTPACVLIPVPEMERVAPYDGIVGRLLDSKKGCESWFMVATKFELVFLEAGTEEQRDTWVKGLRGVVEASNSSPPISFNQVNCSDAHFWCFECGGAPHDPLPCSEWDAFLRMVKMMTGFTLDENDGAGGGGDGKDAAKEKEQFLITLSDKWLKLNTKPCPTCHGPVLKNDGCNHMYVYKKCNKLQHAGVDSWIVMPLAPLATPSPLSTTKCCIGISLSHTLPPLCACRPLLCCAHTLVHYTHYCKDM